MSKFEELDAAICDAIKDGTATYGGLCGHIEVRPTADAMSVAHPLDLRKRKNNGDRMIDRRLQALRKAGSIRQARRGVWEVA